MSKSNRYSPSLPDLEHCPFCGQKPKWDSSVLNNLLYVGIRCGVGCYANEVSTSWPLDQAGELSRRWNTRTQV